MPDAFDYLRISLLPSIGPARGRALLSKFHSFQNMLSASEADLRKVDGINTQLSRRIAQALREQRQSGAVERTVDESRRLCERHGIRFVSFPEEGYPSILRSIYDPPLFLFMRGELKRQDERSAAVVGTRSPSDYGRQVTEHFCRHFAAEGITVVSGLAMGIDTVAHRSSLSAGGRTIAVLGSGVLNVYPGVNRGLAASISEQGCVMSELPLDAKPDATNFPRRNRIISGLSRCLIVTESDVRGGAMITANIALDQNRDLFAVPGSIYNPRSAGPHRLLRASMAQAVTSPEDVLEEVAALGRGDKSVHLPPLQLSLNEQRLHDLLSEEPTHIDELAVECGLSLPSLLVDLLQMELNGIVRQLPGKYFVRGSRRL
ncbi:MAG: DNA-protecting protein DprA [Bacteroidetes bacterium]|nr:DNA-protecting protein DprA [Bacteroidota bacterium]